MTIGIDSRFNRSTAIRVVDMFGKQTRKLYLDIWPRFTRVRFNDDSQYTMRQGDEWSHLGARFLGNPYQWWVIAEANRVVNPWEDLASMRENGDEIRVPSITRANFEYLSFGRSRVQP